MWPVAPATPHTQAATPRTPQATSHAAHGADVKDSAPVHGSRPPLERCVEYGSARRDASCVRSWRCQHRRAHGPRTPPSARLTAHNNAFMNADTGGTTHGAARCRRRNRYPTRLQLPRRSDPSKIFWVAAKQHTANGTPTRPPPKKDTPAGDAMATSSRMAVTQRLPTRTRPQTPGRAGHGSGDANGSVRSMPTLSRGTTPASARTPDPAEGPLRQRQGRRRR